MIFNNVNNFNNMSDREKKGFFALNALELIHYGDGIKKGDKIKVFEITDTKIGKTGESIYRVYSPIDGISFPISELKYVKGCMFELTFGEDDDYYHYELYAVKLANPFDEEGYIKKDLK